MGSRNIKDCCQELQDVWPLMKAAFEASFIGWRISLDCTHRTPEEQFEDFKIGRALNPKTGNWEVQDSRRVVTNVDGKKKLSNHNHYPALAFDVRIQNPEGHFTWNYDLPQWQWMAWAAERFGLVSGATFKTLYDPPHFEVKKT